MNDEDVAIEHFHALVETLVAEPKKREYPEMKVEQDGNKIYASMSYNGIDAHVRVPLQFLYMDKEQKLKFLKQEKIVNQLLSKVGF